MAVDDPLIMHVLQPAGDSQNLTSKMKIKEITAERENGKPASAYWLWGSCGDIP